MEPGMVSRASLFFGHSNVVKILLQNGADPNLKNNMGDTPLHKSALTARKEIVDVLIECGADARLINADGFKPVDITAVQCIKETLEAAEIVLTKREEGELLDAASANDAVRVSLMLKSPFPPNIDCVNINGNSPLHNAAYRFALDRLNGSIWLSTSESKCRVGLLKSRSCYIFFACCSDKSF
eukprot:m.235192 g.235192  ORF g.235192 m.235192 type:complete len:183 (+) comp40123_c0_seq45:224-772(+)